MENEAIYGIAIICMVPLSVIISMTIGQALSKMIHKCNKKDK